MMKLVVCALVTVLCVNGRDGQTYDYKSQGADWITLSNVGWVCDGKMQSPYGFTVANAPTTVDPNNLAIYSYEGEADFTVHQFVNNYIKVVPTSSKDTLTYASITYTLEHYIVRGHSEHQLGGSTAAPDYSVLEIQSYFKSASSEYAVLSLLIDGGGSADLPFVDNLADEGRLSATANVAYTSTDPELDVLGQGMKAFLELPIPSFLKYEGSLTYPPCTEGVIWLVGRDSIKVPNDKLMALKNKVQYKDTFDGATATHGNWRTPPTGHQDDIDADPDSTVKLIAEYEYSTGDAFFAVPATSVLLVTLAALVSTVG